MRNLFLLLFLNIFIFSTGSFAQQIDDTIKVDTNLVTIGVSVSDSKGRFIEGLQKEDFQIFDNASNQKVSFLLAEEAPVSFGIIYDLHPTTSTQTKLVLNSLTKFTSELREIDRFSITIFNEHGSITTGFVPTLEQVERHLSTDIKDKPNSLYDAIFLASEELEETGISKKALLIISDGKDDYSHHSFSSLSEKLNSFNVQIHAVILNEREKWDYADLSSTNQPKVLDLNRFKLEEAKIRELSRKSGGGTTSEPIYNSEHLSEIFRRIATEMQQQYLLGFYPREGDSNKHKLRIELLSKEADEDPNLSYRREYKSNPK